MSGIYIPGMEMPKDCDECWKKFHGFGWVEHDDEWGTFYCEAGKGFCSDPRTKCPLIPVPDHGRLIDADALIEDMKYDVELDAVALDSMEIVGDERRKIQDDKDFKQNCIFWIDNAPTIIPASKEGET